VLFRSKTAACVLMFCMGRPVLPVDTHVHRVSQRVGLIGPAVDEAKAHGVLQSQLLDTDVYPYHVQLIRLGRRVCDARKPQCGVCPLSERCAYAIQESKKPTVKLPG
jgi:endonuclease-3